MGIFSFSYYILAIALFLLAAVFIFMPIRKIQDLHNYYFSLKLMSVSYIALGFYCLFKCQVEIQMFNIWFLLMSNTQANLLGLSHINLIKPQIVTRHYVMYHFMPMLACFILYLIALFVGEPITINSYSILQTHFFDIEVFTRILWFVIYVATSIYYAIVFFREYRLYKKNASNFFANSDNIEIKIVLYSFSIALAVATITIVITICLKDNVCVILNCLILLLYVAMGIFYIQYPIIFAEMNKMFSAENDDKQKLSEINDWQKLKEKIIESKIYLRAGITLDVIAQEFLVSRINLSSMINNNEKVNFNMFINNLRILESQRLLNDDNKILLSEIAEKVGFSEQSNFSKQFKLITGLSPMQYRKSLFDDELLK